MEIFLSSILRLNNFSTSRVVRILFFCAKKGKKDFILNGIQDWLYANTPELDGDTIAFSTNGNYLSFLSFNITNVEKYE